MICLDASVAAKLLLREEWSEQARLLYRTALRAGEPIVAPPLLPFEVTNIVRQQMRSANRLSLDQAIELLEEFLRFSISILYPADLHRQALILADTYGLPATYDAHYLALAEHFGCPLWTDDHRLLRAVTGWLPFVRPISEYSGSS